MSIAFNFGAALPEIVLASAACVILVVDLFVPDSRRQISYWLTQLTLLAAAYLTLVSPDDTPLRAFGNMYVTDKLADVLKLFAYVAVSLTLFYSRGYLTARGLFRGETFVLMLTALLGMMVMISANSFVTLYLGLELMSLSLYAMVALQRESERAVEASMKYFVLGALASGFLLYGMSMLYGATGTLEITGVADAIVNAHSNRVILVFGLVFVVSAIAFKLGAPPRSSPHSPSPCGCSSARCRRWHSTGRACCWSCRCCRCSSATSLPSPRPASSGCWPIRPSPTWASC